MPKIESWRFFRIAKKVLPPGRLQNIWRRSTRLVDMWAANPRDCAIISRNPIDRIRLFLSELDDAGYADYAKAAIDYMAEPLEGRFVPFGDDVSSSGNVDTEVTDAVVSMGELTSLIRVALDDGELDTREYIAIKQAARDHIREVEEILDAAGIRGGGDTD